MLTNIGMNTPDVPGSLTARFSTSALPVLGLLASASLAVAAQPSATPLLMFANDLRFETLPRVEDTRRQLEAAERALQRLPTLETNCATTLGAARFADLWTEVASARLLRGDHAGAALAYRKVLECRPRDPSAYHALAVAVAWSGDRAASRELILRGLELDPTNVHLRMHLAHLAFIDGRWHDAGRQLDAAIALESDPVRAEYHRILWWLAQRRSGADHPIVTTAAIPSDELIDWPNPILRLLRGELTEMELLEELRAGTDQQQRQERLCEALYYVGQDRLARGEAETARLYFAAAVNVKVLDFVEDHLAQAELTNYRTTARMQDRN